jgi:membrane-associated phospholipid phosphatase
MKLDRCERVRHTGLRHERLSMSENGMSRRPYSVRPATGPRLPAGSAARLALLAALLFAGLTTLGLLLTRVLTPSPVSRLDVHVVEWFAAQRTPALNTLSAIGSDLAMTLLVFVMTAVIALVLRVWLGRWREALVLVLCVLGEWVLFRLVNGAVARQRPEPMLERATQTASFPSGHAGIAVAFYGGLALIILRTVTRRSLAIALASVCVAVLVLVAVTRVYRGMHFPTDVLASWLLAGIWITLVVATLLPSRDRMPERRERSRDPGR